MRSPLRRRRGERGQILVLFVFALIVLIGVSALVIDLGLVYATQRSERNVTDAAALAGAQQLIPSGSRAITPASRADARTKAMQVLVDELGATSMPACDYTADVIRCALPGTQYQASIRTPISTDLCSGCDTQRAMLVSLTRIHLETTFARVMGMDGWDVSQASVAEIGVHGRYGVITLRPPKPNHSYSLEENWADLKVDGSGTQLYVANGDIGTNTSVSLTSGGLVLDSGFFAFHYDTGWVVPGVADKPMPTIIPDPGYVIPSSAPVPLSARFADEAAAKDTSGCNAWIGRVPDSYVVPATGVRINTLTTTSSPAVTCYKPGVYAFHGEPSAAIALLEPGLYFMENSGWHTPSHGIVIGGFQPSRAGVALVFKECNSGCDVNWNNADVIALNGGDRYRNPTGHEAAAAQNTFVSPSVDIKTGPTSKPPNQPLTIMVRPQMIAADPACTAFWNPVWAPDGSWQETATCADTANNTLKMAGGGSLYLAGVTYAPSDNVAVSGGSGGMGYVGQMVTWTLTISGGTHITQRYPDGPDNGVLRLNDKCSGSTYIAGCYP